MRSFIGVTAHFICDWHLQSAVLACKRSTAATLLRTLHSRFEDIVQCFGVQKKIQAVTTDNAANMVKAFKLPGFVPVEMDDEQCSDYSDSEESELEDTQTDQSGLFEVDAAAIATEHE